MLLAAAGYTLVPFHATGIGGRTMEKLIAEGYFDAVLDLTTTEWADEVVGGDLSAGPTGSKRPHEPACRRSSRPAP